MQAVLGEQGFGKPTEPFLEARLYAVLAPDHQRRAAVLAALRIGVRLTDPVPHGGCAGIVPQHLGEGLADLP